MSNKIIGKQRSKIANDKKKEYIKRGKKSTIIQKLNSQAKSSKLHDIKKVHISDSDDNSEDISIDSDDSEQYIIHFNSDDDDNNIRRNKYKQKNNTKDKSTLELQKEIEALKLEQIKQNKKVEKNSSKMQKPVNHKADALKSKLLVEF